MLKTERECITCRATKSGDEFYSYGYTTNQGKRSIRHDSRCKDCAKARRKEMHGRNRTSELQKMAARRKKNRDRYLANLYGFRMANRDHVLTQRVVHEQKRTAKKYGKPDKAMIDRVLAEARFGNRYLDAYTGELIDNPVVDHIVPLSRGGEHAYENLCVTSRQMNSSKHSKQLLVWLATRV